MNLGQFAVFARILGLGKSSGAVAGGASGVNDTASLQAIINTIAGNPGKGLKIPDGHYKINAPLTIGVDNTSIVTGLKIEGSSRGGVIIEQMTDNQPIFTITGQFVHSLTFKSMTLTYTNQQVSNGGGNCFQVNGPNGGSFYNTAFEDIYATNHDWFMNVPTVTAWGISQRRLWLSQFASGVNQISATAGEPRCTFEDLYITGERASKPLFSHKSVTGWYNNIELNNFVNGPPIITDGNGGTHVIGHMALEGANFAAGTTQLFDCQNSRVVAKYIYLTSLTLAAGATVYAFHCESGKSTAQIDVLELSFTANAGQFYCFNSQGPLPGIIGDVTGLNPAGGSTLCDIAGSAAGNFCEVKRWNDPDRIGFLADAAKTLAYDDAMTWVLDVPLTASRTVNLPQGTAAASSAIFTGRKFRFIRTKNSTGAFNLDIKDSTGATTVVSLAANANGVIAEVSYARSGAATGFTWVRIMNLNNSVSI